jgi:hypothetical protein
VNDTPENPVEWSEPLLVEFEFKFGEKERAGHARLGLPRPDEAHPGIWVCAFQILGWKDDRIRLARGGDGLQAVMIASTVIRKSLDRIKAFRPDGIAHESVFPRYLPFCYGIDFHRKLCDILDAEIKKKDRQLSKLRLARKQPVRSPRV